MALSNVLAVGAPLQVGRRHRYAQGPLDRASTNKAILRWQENLDARGHAVRHQCRDSSAQINEHARAQFLGNAASDDRLSIHIRAH